MNAAALAVLSWLVTYALHSVLLLLALVITERWWARSAAVGDLLYKVGAFAPVLTASLQFGLLTRAPAVEPLGGRWEMPALAVTVLPEAVSPALNEPVREPRMQTENVPQVAIAPQPDITPSTVTTRALVPWYTLLAGAWLIGVAASLGFFVRRYTRAHRRFARRTVPAEPELTNALERLRASMGYTLPVKLTVCDGVVSPVALNRREICLPTGLLASLTPHQVESMLAHELAHLRRRDPAWLLAFGFLEAVFYFQPLNRVARRRFQVYAERLCDQWSLRYVPHPLALAQCLAEVARWLSGAEPVPYAGMAEHDS